MTIKGSDAVAVMDMEDVEVGDAAEENVQMIPSASTEDRTKKRPPTMNVGNGTNGAVNTAGQNPSTSAVVKPRKGRSGKKDGASAGVGAGSSKVIKYLALFLLVAQMVGLVLLMRYTRTHKDPDQPLYLASTAVFIMEVMKFVICVFVVAYQSNGRLVQELNTHIIQSPIEVLKLCVPSLLYTIQNNLLYVALTNLDAATYQVCYQLKILTTALFSSILLGRQFSVTKWSSLVILTIGVAIVQVSNSGDSHSKSGETDGNVNNRTLGLICVLCAACTSGFSGVYFERILKGSKTSLWIRNIQMGIPSVIIAYITVILKDSTDIAKQGFLGGYTPLVWTVVTVQAAGGLIVAVVVKYADNVLKVFATSFSIIISCIICSVLFDFRPTFAFIVGATMVVIATIMYSSPEKKVRDRAKGRKKSAALLKPLLPVVASPSKGQHQS